MLPKCPDCGLRPRYLADGKWASFDKINTMLREPHSISVRPQHSRRCMSFDASLRRFLRS